MGDRAARKLGRKSPRRPKRGFRSGWCRRASNHAGRSMKRTLQRRHITRQKPVPDNQRSRPAPLSGKAAGLGEEPGACTQASSRRTGDGTCGRSVDPKQGTTRRRLTSKDPFYKRGTPGNERESVSGADRVVVAMMRVDSITPAEPRTRGLAWFRKDGEAGPDMPQGQPEHAERVASRNERFVKRGWSTEGRI